MGRLPPRSRARLTFGLSELIASLDARVAAMHAGFDAALSDAAAERRALVDRIGRLEEEVAAMRRLIVDQDEHGQRRLRAGLSSAISLLSVLPRLDIEGVLPPFPDHGFEVTGELAAFLYHLVRRHRPKLVVELGSGSSTVLLAASVRANGAGRVVSVEHDPEHAGRTARLLEQTQLSEWVELVDAPLVEQRFAGVSVRWYSLDRFLRGLAERIDVVFVDGPPGKIQRLSRYPALPALARHLSPHAMILVDDAGRADERRMMELWGELGIPFDIEPLDSLPRAPVLLRIAGHDTRVAELRRAKDEAPPGPAEADAGARWDRRTGTV